MLVAFLTSKNASKLVTLSARINNWIFSHSNIILVLMGTFKRTELRIVTLLRRWILTRERGTRPSMTTASRRKFLWTRRMLRMIPLINSNAFAKILADRMERRIDTRKDRRMLLSRQKPTSRRKMLEVSSRALFLKRCSVRRTAVLNRTFICLSKKATFHGHLAYHPIGRPCFTVIQSVVHREWAPLAVIRILLTLASPSQVLFILKTIVDPPSLARPCHPFRLFYQLATFLANIQPSMVSLSPHMALIRPTVPLLVPILLHRFVWKNFWRQQGFTQTYLDSY